MDEIKELMNKIEELRGELRDLVKKKNNLLDPEVLEASRKLDELVVEYYKRLKKTGNKKL